MLSQFFVKIQTWHRNILFCLFNIKLYLSEFLEAMITNMHVKSITKQQLTIGTKL